MAKRFIGVKVTGMRQTAEALRRLGKKAPKALASAFFQIAEEIIGEAKEKHVPVDLGHLRSSGFVDLPKIQGGNVSVELGFGGPAGKGNQAGTSNSIDVGYALIVHENLTAHHTVGRAKYLELPFNQAQTRLDGRAAELIRKFERDFA